uniref:Proteasome assembly chaperone 1 n=1 Tax=Periophthalmus magnuspinnatus TaxID=409849 RepID=A0A3B3ZYH1_9GOBI
MATFFGEVLSVYSRAVEEDDDDDEEEQDEEDQLILRELEDKRQVRVRWSPTIEQSPDSGHRLPCPHLLLAVGHNATRFVSVYFLSHGGWDAVGHVSLWNERTVHSEDTTCVLHRHRESHQVLVCQVDCFVAEDQLFQWTEQVLGSLDASQVTVLSDCPAAEYQSPQPLGPDPCLRSLHTSAWSEPICCPPVELPNLVSGLPAAVVSFCQLHNISAAVYQCYSDARSADSTTMDMFRPVVARLAQDLKLDFSPDRDILRKFISQANVQSNLYI